MFELKNVYLNFHHKNILDNISLIVHAKESIAIIGGSGSGKSTLLKVIAGLLKIKSGSIVKENSLRFGYVFQQFELFPHLRVIENLTLAPINVLKQPRTAAITAAMTLLERVHMASFAQQYPHELSGGQQQRAAIARALMMHPNVMLFDEPTSALDPEMVSEVLEVIRDLTKSGMTILIASHEMNFIKQSTDRVIFIDHGKLVEEQPTLAFFLHPETKRAQEFLAKMLK